MAKIGSTVKGTLNPVTGGRIIGRGGPTLTSSRVSRTPITPNIPKAPKASSVPTLTPFRGTVESADSGPGGLTFTQKLANLKTEASIQGAPEKTNEAGLPGLGSALQQLTQQRAAISGRAPSRDEIAGTVEGLAAGAQGRLERREEVEQRERFHEDELQSQLDVQNNQIQAQKDLQDQQIASAENIFRAGSEQEQAQFIANFAENQRQFTANMASQQAQFWATFQQGDSQFDAELAQHQADAEQSGVQFDRQLAQNASQFTEAQRQEFDIFSQTLAQQQYETELERSAAERSFEFETEGFAQQNDLPGGGVIDSIVDPLGLTSGGGGTWLCTAMNGHTRVDKNPISTLRRYIKKNHNLCFTWYIIHGPEIVKAVAEKEYDLKSFYQKQHDEWVEPISKTVQYNIEVAYIAYRGWVINLVKKYTPQLFDDVMFLMEDE